MRSTKAAMILGAIAGLMAAGSTLTADTGDIEVLTRGPIHEAFAEPAFGPPQRGPITPKEPPPAIEELPPDQKPQGAAAWITGYWVWDDERNDFVWISGIWRVAPPDRQWVVGYWVKTGGGYQRISGYWAPKEMDQADYLPEPPPSVESGPSSPAPSPAHMWISGCWVWQSNRYLWRTGYWTETDEYWVWIPDHFVSTPAGCIFVAGYWDYPLDRRGMVFAPVYCRRPVYLQPSYRYTPTVVLHTPALALHLFVRPSHCHYYFGDYYDPGCRGRDYHYWCHWHSSGIGWDPLFVFYHQRHRHDHRWLDDHRRHFDELTHRPDARPAHRFYERREAPVAATGKKSPRVDLASRLEDVSALDQRTKLVKVVGDERNLALRTVRQQRSEQAGRAKLEEQARELRNRPVSGTVATKLSVPGASQKARVVLQPAKSPVPPSPGKPATTAGAKPALPTAEKSASRAARPGGRPALIERPRAPESARPPSPGLGKPSAPKGAEPPKSASKPGRSAPQSAGKPGAAPPSAGKPAAAPPSPTSSGDTRSRASEGRPSSGSTRNRTSAPGAADKPRP